MGHTLRPVPTPPPTLRESPSAMAYTLGRLFMIHDIKDGQHHLSVRVRRGGDTPTDSELKESWGKVVGDGLFAVVPLRGAMRAIHLFSAPEGTTPEDFVAALREQGARALGEDGDA